VDATIQPGEGGAPEVRLDYRLPRAELLFERGPDGYRAAYEVRVIFYRSKGGRQVTGDTFQRELRAPSYSATRSSGQDIVDHVTFRVAPGKYVIEVALTDLIAERTSGTAVELEVPSAPQGQIWITDLSLGTLSSRAADSAGVRGRLDPNPSRRFGENIGSLAAYGEIVDTRPEGSREPTYRIEYRIVSDPSDDVFRADTVIARGDGRTPMLLAPKISTLDPGTYRFVVELLGIPPAPGRKKPERVRREKAFDVDQSIASFSADPRSSLEVLRYIAEPQEITEMDRITSDEARRKFWEDFWKRRDRTPETPRNEEMEEFYQRVQYANQHFGVGTPGWRTDMGRIYIKLGKPDEVVRNPFNFDRPPEEIWYYYRERKTYFFVDRDGFGRFELDPSRSSS
jgi:GWxTD domain-containing protein